MDLIEEVAKQAGISKVKAKVGIDTVFSCIREAIKKEENVTVVGFGTFFLGGRRTRVGRNPRTGEVLTIRAARIPKFQAGKRFKDEVQNGIA